MRSVRARSEAVPPVGPGQSGTSGTGSAPGRYVRHPVPGGEPGLLSLLPGRVAVANLVLVGYLDHLDCRWSHSLKNVPLW